MFDRYVAAQHQTAGARRRRVLVLVSVIAHALALVGLLVWSVVHVEAMAPPPITVTFFKASAPPPPPPPPPAGARHKPTPKPRTPRPHEAQPLVQPRTPE